MRTAEQEKARSDAVIAYVRSLRPELADRLFYHGNGLLKFDYGDYYWKHPAWPGYCIQDKERKLRDIETAKACTNDRHDGWMCEVAHCGEVAKADPNAFERIDTRISTENVVEMIELTERAYGCLDRGIPFDHPDAKWITGPWDEGISLFPPYDRSNPFWPHDEEIRVEVHVDGSDPAYRLRVLARKLMKDPKHQYQDVLYATTYRHTIIVVGKSFNDWPSCWESASRIQYLFEAFT